MKHPTPEQLSAFHDAIADAKTLVAVEMHLNECAECHEVLVARVVGERPASRERCAAPRACCAPWRAPSRRSWRGPAPWSARGSMA